MLTRSTALAALGLVLASAHGASANDTQVPPSLVFERGGDLYRMTIDGSETVQLTATGTREHSPAVSPDRLQIAFVRGNDELWLIDTNGNGQRRLLAPRPPSVRDGSTGSPSWSPRGRTLFFDRWRSRCGSIFRISSDGRALKRVTRHHVSESSPAPSPDGRRIAISASSYCDPGWSGRLAVIDTSGRATPELRKFRSPVGFDVEPTWSPDGRQIAFVAWDLIESGRSALYVVSRDGSRLRRITRWTFETGGPAWSPDAEWIAFHKEGGLYLIRPDGSELRRAPGTKASDASPAWLPRI